MKIYAAISKCRTIYILKDYSSILLLTLKKEVESRPILERFYWRIKWFYANVLYVGAFIFIKFHQFN